MMRNSWALALVLAGAAGLTAEACDLWGPLAAGDFKGVKSCVDSSNVNVLSGSDSPLTAAAQFAFRDPADIVALLLDEGAKINFQGDERRTALMNAAGKAWTQSVDLLIKKGADVRPRDANGRTALMYAGDAYDPTIVDQLVAAGAKVNDADVDGRTPLMAAVVRVRKMG
ncbi:MAG TPA: ankyrin repeat domain-containing protein, partial [Elusimicrobiota bacterium]|nr:ankyrin repeat domain-containing protein [Elusimicrobiota bacterium]